MHSITSRLLLVTVCTLLLFHIHVTTIISGHRLHRYDRLNKLYGATTTKGYASDEPLEQWFHGQRLDHYDTTDSRTWSQRFFVNETYFRRDTAGPVFLFIGGEGPLGARVVTDRFVLARYAAMFGGLVVALEHRFYGRSLPLPDLSTEHLKYLNSQQALADLARFIPHVRKLYNVPDRSKLIVFGGSYPGNMAAWFRMKYPHLTVGAIASSAPVKAALDFHEYMEVVADALGPRCNKQLRAAVDTVEKIIDEGPAGLQRLDRLFNTCDTLAQGPTKDDLALFMSSLADPVCGIVQYNNGNNGYMTFNITRLCNIFDNNPTDALGALSSFISQYNKEMGQDCIATRYDKYLDEMKSVKTWPENDAAAGRAWVWQTCTEFGYYQAAVGLDQPFSNRITMEWFIQQCEQIYGIPNLVPDIDWTNDYYGSDTPIVTNVVWVNGDIDPWHYLSTHKQLDPTSPFYFIKGTSHCADLYAPSPYDLPELTAARSGTLSAIRKWLSQ